MSMSGRLPRVKVLKALFCMSLVFLLTSVLLIVNPSLNEESNNESFEHLAGIRHPDGRQKVVQVGGHAKAHKAPVRNPVQMADRPLPEVGGKQKQLYGINYGEMQFVPRTNKERLAEVRKLLSELQVHQLAGKDPWALPPSWLTSREILPKHVPRLGEVLYAMSSRDVVRADVGYKGTQLKLRLILKGGQVVVFKPQWTTKEKIFKGIYEGPDRHNAEIVAFYLSRVLQLRRAPIVVGRKLDLLEEILPVATPALKRTFFYRGNKTCFYGRCLYCKGPETGVCGEGSMLEGAVILWLPLDVKLYKHKHPWARSYKRGRKARWENDQEYCSKVRQVATYNNTVRLMDIIDTCIFDFIMGNADRHNYETLGPTSQDAMLMMDNGKGFGNPYHDESTILAPLYQCCRVRRSTWARLMQLRNGVLLQTLSGLMEDDPLSPLLSFPHLEAMERRLHEIFDKVDRCVRRHGHATVLVNDKL